MNHAFVVFFYGVFPGSFEKLAQMDITLHHLCTWWDVLEACRDRPYFAETALAEVRRFLENPVAWSAAHGGVSSRRGSGSAQEGEPGMRAALLLATVLPVLAGCVAPEPEPVRRPVRATADAPLPAGLEPAPLANRKAKAPEAQKVIQVDGMGGKPKSGTLPPL